MKTETWFMNGNKEWYMVYTRRGYEKKLAENLSRKKIESYCPLNKLKGTNNDRKAMVNEPLFNSYVFAKISGKELLILKNTAGVINLVYWIDKPAIIGNAEIEIIKKVLNEYTNVKVEKAPRESIVKHQVQLFSINNTIKIILPSLGYLLIAETKTTDQEISIRTITDQFDLLHPVYAIK